MSYGHPNRVNITRKEIDAYKASPVANTNTDKALINALQKQVAQLKRKAIIWKQSDKEMPEHNKGCLVFIPEEDNHITAGMWDVSEKWVLLDDYREPKSIVTHWAYMPDEPIIEES